MKRISHTLTYPDTTVDEVYAMLGDPAFRKAVCEEQGVTRSDCSVTPSAGGMTVRIQQFRPSEGLPGFAAKFVGDEIELVQEEVWSSPSSATVHVAIPGKPGEMSGGAGIYPAGHDVEEQIDLALKVSVPLVGGKIEELVAGMLTKAFRAENEVGKRWLRGER